MKKHHRHPNGRAKKWIETRLAGAYKKRRAIAICYNHLLAKAALFHLQTIRSTLAPALNKKIAMAETVTAAHMAIARNFAAAKTPEAWAAYHNRGEA